MVRILLFFFCSALLACSGNGDAGTTTDSLRLSVDSSAERIGDSIKTKAERLEDSIEARFNDDRDSAR